MYIYIYIYIYILDHLKGGLARRQADKTRAVSPLSSTTDVYVYHLHIYLRIYVNLRRMLVVHGTKKLQA